MSYINNPNGGGGSGTIPEYYTDPVSPTPGQTWVLATLKMAAGSPIGLLLSLTYSISVYTYQLSYYTSEGTIIRTPLN